MFDSKMVREMAKQFADSLPPGLKALNKEAEQQFHQFLQAWFSKMSLVTREEFDTQTQVLAKTRHKLEQLELMLAELEKKLNTSL